MGNSTAHGLQCCLCTHGWQAGKLGRVWPWPMAHSNFELKAALMQKQELRGIVRHHDFVGSLWCCQVVSM